jgi:hypothetical protein
MPPLDHFADRATWEKSWKLGLTPRITWSDPQDYPVVCKLLSSKIHRPSALQSGGDPYRMPVFLDMSDITLDYNDSQGSSRRSIRGGIMAWGISSFQRCGL